MGMSDSTSRPVVAVYGGSFNPPHVVHAMIASWLIWTGKASAVWLVPVFQHPFEGKQSKKLASYARRYRWCELLACELGPWARVCSIEAELPPPSYSWTTLQALAQRHPEFEFRLVIGSDVLAQVGSWHRWGDICREHSPIVVGREGQGGRESPTFAFPDVSSTTIRRKLRIKEEVDNLVLASVLADIHEQVPEEWSETG